METLPAAPINWESELAGAKALMKSGLLPQAIKSAESALFIILTGRDLGLSPVQSLRSIHIISGKVELSADLQLGLFQRSGGKFRWLKLDASGAQLELSAPWLNAPHVSVFGPEEAKKAELMSTPNYRKYPQAMFRSRAITQGLKDIGFLASSGVYAPGELGGEVVVDTSTGEVLPAPEEAKPAVTMEISTTAGVVEALDDTERSRLADVALALSEALREGMEVQAWKLWDGCDNDQKTAVWAQLDRETRHAVKALSESMRREPTPEPEPQETAP